ncbi:MAG: SDR family NAD(P)-dependent oxidoreductase [Candidatus Dadabacteria bacterium]|nr:MAG: SDR family NAD(P)-dependent oxidoreductase [Candidatus Dadabacteria bacterium]
MTYKILVTGGAGFIGSHLVDRLIEDGHEVRILDNLDRQVHQGKKPEYINPQAEFIMGDIRDLSTVKEALKDVEILFHQAAAVGVGQSMYKIKHYVDVNTYGTAKLLNHLVNEEHDVKKLVVASSMSIYGEGSYYCDGCGNIHPKLRTEDQLKAHEWEMKCPNCKSNSKPIPTSEDKPLHPTSTYAITKRDQEEMCLVTGRAYGIPTIALRYFNVYGPRQSLSNPYTGVAAIFLSRIKNGNPPLIFEDGLQSRDFINVKDIVEANILAMRNSNMDYQEFNIGTGTPTTVLDIAHTLIALRGADVKPEIIGRYRKGDIRHCYADIDKVKRYGFTPKVTLKEGMSELVEWSSQVRASDAVEKAEQELVEKGLIL